MSIDPPSVKIHEAVDKLHTLLDAAGKLCGDGPDQFQVFIGGTRKEARILTELADRVQKRLWEIGEHFAGPGIEMMGTATEDFPAGTCLEIDYSHAARVRDYAKRRVIRCEPTEDEPGFIALEAIKAGEVVYHRFNCPNGPWEAFPKVPKGAWFDFMNLTAADRKRAVADGAVKP